MNDRHPSTIAAQLFDQHPEGMLLVDPRSLRIVEANRVARALLGYEAAAIGAIDITSIESSIENVFFWDEVKDGRYYEIEPRDGYYRGRDGQIISVNKRISVVQADAREYLLITFHDIAASKSIEDQLLHSASLLTATLEATADGILVTRIDGGISKMNQRFAQMWNIPEHLLDAAVDAGIFDYLAEQVENRSEYLTRLEEILRDGAAHSLDTLALQDGRFFERYATPLVIEGRYYGFVFSFRDVSDRKHAEVEHKQYELKLQAKNSELETANRVKTDFLANMSHEIRTPMNAIIGLSRLCLGTSLAPTQRDYLEKISRSSHSLLEIINDILDFSKIESGKLTIESIPFSLTEVLDQVHETVMLAAQQKGLALRVEIDPRCKEQLSRSDLIGDPLRLRQVLLNLVSNAVKFTAYGSVVVQIQTKQIDEQRATLQFSVIDSGIGITKDQLDGLFSAFSQADASTTRKYGGTGLGLAISKSLVEMMHGRLWVESVPGAGSTFTFTASFGKAARSETQTDAGRGREALDPIAVHQQPLLGAQVLVVEDNDINQQIAYELLTQAGATVTIARNGVEGVSMVDNGRYDVVLMDIQMPVMDGYAATANIRAQSRFASLPIIAMTANAMSTDVERARTAGMNAHIAKPIDADLLIATVHKWMQKQSAATHSDSKDTQPDSQPRTATKSTLPASLPGLDFDAAKKALGGSDALLNRLLVMFARDHSSDANRIGMAIATADTATAQRIAHTLKGVAGSIGALELQAASAALEKALRAAPLDTHTDLLIALTAALAKVVQSLRALGLGPDASIAAREEATNESMAPAHDRAVVLVVDDEPMITTVISTLLKADYEVLIADNGAKALDIASREHPDMILLDISMPGIDGYEVCRRLKAQAGTRSIPIAFVSSADSPEEIARGLALGAVEYLKKPVRADAVKSALKKHLRSSAA